MDAEKTHESVILKLLSQSSMPLVITNVSYDANSNAEYIGVAMQGSADDEAAWRIERIEWEADPLGGYRRLRSRFSSSKSVWDARATLSYS